MKRLLTLILLVFSCSLMSQNIIQADSVLKDLRQHKKKSKFYKKLAYEALMFLENDSYNFLNSIKPERRIFHKPETNPEFEKSIDVKHNSSDICDLFFSKYFKKSIIPKISIEGDYIIDDIYYKLNQGYLNLSSQNNSEYYWSNSYILKFEKGVLYYTLTYSVME